MKKKLSVLALAGVMSLPVAALAGGEVDVEDLERKILELSKQLEELKVQISRQAETGQATSEQVAELSDVVDDMEYRAYEWDLAARFKFSGDFRSRYDFYNAETVFGRTLENDSLFTNRFRLNLQVLATENVEFKGRLAMYKTWGMQSAFSDESGAIWPVFDGNVSRSPVGDSALYVDRAYVNWNNVGGAPVWISVGRRPTTDGVPAQIRMGVDERLATPVAFMDWPFDGFVLGYGYQWGNESLGIGKIRFCYGRGFEDGLQEDSVINDVDFAGFNWDVFDSGDRLLNVQSFMAFNVFNYPNFQDPIINANFGDMSGLGARKTLGNILHTDLVYQASTGNWNYFVAGGWSQSRPNENGMFNDYAAMAAGLSGPETDENNGYAFYAGLRYDIDDLRLKVGAEYNYGSEYWLALTPGHDDIYQSKLATRGQVFEVYTIYDIPAGEAISRYGKAFIRLGYQHYEYDYSGSGDWNMAPYDLGNAGDRMMLQMMGLDPVESADQVYLTFEAFF
ncbi:DUF3373 domain-containing protein [Desulfofustis glycolicus]|uniref:DUF3373 domain-containing protein n=1 Tax=Desulfofustis glycolicus DSM 9705 TaxID=1121409 RepID=A0A1M5VKB3_9BACT|nr:DUF3373 domain-containing protein [Desulfofustis glycolicus]SHH75722.1 Protein of unknown function [Desulfofustis glycolicus DSM 9705]